MDIGLGLQLIINRFTIHFTMSANNLIQIRETFKGSISVAEYDADSGAELEYIGNFDSMEQAIREARKYNEKENVEYGIQV